jgi:zinc protease
MQKRLVLACLFVLCLFLSSTAVFGQPPVKRSVLENGLTLLVSEEHSLPFVTLQLIIKVGSKDDPTGREGLADLTSGSLLLGAAGRSVKQISEEVDFLGAFIGAGANKDYTAVSLRVLKKDLKTIFPLFMDVVMKPTFPAGEIKKEIAKTLAAIQSSEDRPGYVADRAFQRALYRGGFYGHPNEGTKESVAQLTPGLLRTFHGTHYHPNNSILTVVGDVDQDLINGYLIPGLEKWPRKKVPERKLEPVFQEKQETIKIQRPLTQSNIVIGHRGISRDNPDYYKVLMMNYILGGGGLTSRLVEEIRNKRGLAYSVGSGFDARKYPGSFRIVLQTKTASTREAIESVIGEMERMRTEPVSESELEEAKKYIIGSFPQRFGTQSAIASFLGQVEYFGLGLDYPAKFPSLINSITRGDILEAARKYLHPDNYILVVATDLKQAGL